MMRRFCLLCWLILACSSAQLDSLPLDDPSTYASDASVSDLSFLDSMPSGENDDWSTFDSTEPPSSLDWSSDMFDETPPDFATSLSDDLGGSYLSEGSSASLLSTTNGCLSAGTPVSRIRGRAGGGDEPDQCHNSAYQDFTPDDVRNEEIKKQWCGREPWLGFGNIPVARFTGSLLFPVPLAALPDVLISPPVPVFFNVLRGALRKCIPSTAALLLLLVLLVLLLLDCLDERTLLRADGGRQSPTPSRA